MRGQNGGAGPARVGTARLDAGLALAYVSLTLLKTWLFPTLPVWPGAGVALAAGLLVGDRAWRGIFAGSLLSSVILPVASASLSAQLAVGILIAVGHALATVAAARALRRVIALRNPLYTPADTLRFCLWGVGTYALVLSCIAAAAYRLGNAGEPPLVWLTGVIVGTIVIAPVILAWRQTERRLLRRGEKLEAAATALVALGITASLYSSIYASLPPDLPVGALFVLPLLWAALRLDQRLSVSLMAACLLITWYGTAAGEGALVDVAGPVDALSRAARVSGILAAILLMVSAVSTERTRAEEALRRSDARLRLALATGRVGVWDWDLRSDSMTWSDGHFALLGLKAGSVLPTYAAWAKRVHPDDLARVELAMQRARAECATYGSDFRVVWPDGSTHWVEARGQFLGSAGEENQALRMMAAMVDLTERKQAESALEETSRQKDEFLAMLAHELRNPLAPIRNATYVLRQSGSVEPRVQRFYDMIDRQVEHMVRLVDDLLDVSRVSSGKIRLQKERVDLSAVVLQAVETVQSMIDRKGQVLNLELWPEAIEVEADPARLVQVIGNLLTNATKFTPEHGRISVRTERVGPSATIRVHDTGVGIAPELLPRIFDLFVQGTVSLDRAEGGLGIGLPLVRRLVEMHGGRVVAQSAGLNQGSELVVTWPALTSAVAVKPTSDAQPSLGQSSRERLRILVVEDNVEVAESLVLLLDTTGHEVRTAYSGFDALDLATVFAPDVAFIDLGLPGLDGYEVARRLRQRSACQATLLVALSGYGRDEDIQRARAAGFDRHLTKPVHPTTIENLLAQAQSERAKPPAGP